MFVVLTFGFVPFRVYIHFAGTIVIDNIDLRVSFPLNLELLQFSINERHHPYARRYMPENIKCLFLVHLLCVWVFRFNVEMI